MSAPSIPSRLLASRSVWQTTCAIGAAFIGLILLSYAVYFVPRQLAGTSTPVAGFLGLLALIGLFSLLGAAGYWQKKVWGLYFHFVSVLGQFFLPGSLFEFKLDLYHLVGWMAPIISLVILLIMRGQFRRTKRTS